MPAHAPGIPDAACVSSAKIRPATFADFNAVLQLIEACNLDDYDSPMVSAQHLKNLWRSSRLSLARDTWVLPAPDGAPLGYAELEHCEPAHFSPTLYIEHAQPASERQAIGVELLQRAEKRALACCSAQQLDYLGPYISLSSRVSERDVVLQQIYADLGYTKKYSFLIMERQMDAPPQAPAWPAGVRVRAFKPCQDEQAAYQADEEASLDKGYHQPLNFEDWARRMSLHTPSFDPSLWFLACQDDQIAGVALNQYAPETITGWIDHLGVRKNWRKRGLGNALLLHSLAAFYRRGITRVRLSVDSHSLTHAPRLYERAGMTVVQQYHIYRKELRQRSVSGS